MYYLLLPATKTHRALIEHLKTVGIFAVFHYLSLYLPEFGQRFGGREGDCPATEDLSAQLLRLPFYYELSATEQIHATAALQTFNCRLCAMPRGQKNFPYRP